MVLTASVMDALSFAFIQTYSRRHCGDLIRPDFKGRPARLTEAEIERYRHVHDGVLDWDVPPGRIRPRLNTAGESWSHGIDETLPASSAVLSAFGDS